MSLLLLLYFLLFSAIIFFNVFSSYIYLFFPRSTNSSISPFFFSTLKLSYFLPFFHFVSSLLRGILIYFFIYSSFFFSSLLFSFFMVFLYAYHSSDFSFSSFSSITFSCLLSFIHFFHFFLHLIFCTSSLLIILFSMTSKCTALSYRIFGVFAQGLTVALRTCFMCYLSDTCFSCLIYALKVLRASGRKGLVKNI